MKYVYVVAMIVAWFIFGLATGTELASRKFEASEEKLATEAQADRSAAEQDIATIDQLFQQASDTLIQCTKNLAEARKGAMQDKPLASVPVLGGAFALNVTPGPLARAVQSGTAPPAPTAGPAALIEWGQKIWQQMQAR